MKKETLLNFEKAQVSPKGDNWDFEGLKITQTQYNTHFFHHYTAKFIPQIPQNIIKMFKKRGDIVLDPFSGSGTTSVEAKLQGLESYGVEINPLSVKIAKAKTTRINYDQLDELIRWLDKSTKNDQTLVSEDITLYPESDKWFRKDVRFKLSQIIKQINELDNTTKNFAEVGLSSLLKGMSNARMDLTMPTLPKENSYVDRKHYDRKMNNETREIPVYSRLSAKLKRMKSALKEQEQIGDYTPTHIIEGDSRRLSKYIPGEVNIIVTSPPYWSAQNYQELHSLSFDLYKLKEPKLGEIGRDKKAYLKDMEEVITEISKVLNGKFAFVIGESKDNLHKDLFDIILSHGMKEYKTIKRNITMHSFFAKGIKQEFIYVFEK